MLMLKSVGKDWINGASEGWKRERWKRNGWRERARVSVLHACVPARCISALLQRLTEFAHDNAPCQKQVHKPRDRLREGERREWRQ
ncbi:hypothetical protein QQF64_001439 [Cirrhinus molitorella]|uniref:Uncharacterized protein n=1 Tax=Cirrhinus molitorella TaxID=172907 RepID=A0ABR3P1E5_9TELE